MARHDGEIRSRGSVPLSVPELLRLLGSDAEITASSREAIACYLAGGEGWREAAKLLDGTFAEGGIKLSGTTHD